jgi:hypothetical protein
MASNPDGIWGDGEVYLDLTGLDMRLDVPNIDKFADYFGLLRKNGFGSSDSGAVCGISPFTSQAQLVEDKARNYLTEEDKKIGTLTSVMKGRDLEPLILKKSQMYKGYHDLKPSCQYRSTAYTWITYNFDGVLVQDHANGKYIPDEAKVLTRMGEKHYDMDKAYFTESRGYADIPQRIDKTNNTIETKAALYGIPPYYYTQVQQQILALKAPYGYLTIMRESMWEVHSWWIWRDDAVITQLIVDGQKLWDKVLELRGRNWSIPGLEEVNAQIETETANVPVIAGGTLDAPLDINTGKIII